MKKIFEHPTSVEVGHFDSILRGMGIPTVIRNLDGSSLMGEVPFTTVFPELWVLDDADYDRATAVLEDYRRRSREPVSSPDWICPGCGESVPGNFDVCWNCGVSADSGAPRPAIAP